MTRTTSCFLLLAALSLGAAPALAQGTPEQREACTPDALRLCSDTVPDVGRTTACMAAHRAELSPRCQAAFAAGAPAASKPRTRVVRARAAPKARVADTNETATKAVRRRAAHMAIVPPAPHRRVHLARGDSDTREARRVIGRLCAGNVIDGGTCGFMGRMLNLAD